MEANSLTGDGLAGLYLITDHDRQEDAKLYQDVEKALAAGASVLQYRDKSGDQEKQLRQSHQLRQLTSQYHCLFIINDDIELAQQVRADGVHLGRHDPDIARARQLLGNRAVIGISCYNSLELAATAAAQGASYVAFGRFFASQTKPDAVQAQPELICQAKNILEIPIVAIGGITPDNAPALIDAGADMLAVINAVFAAKDITSATQKFISVLISKE